VAGVGAAPDWAQSTDMSTCEDTDFERFNMKFFFLMTNKSDRHYSPDKLELISTQVPLREAKRSTFDQTSAYLPLNGLLRLLLSHLL